MHARKLMLSVVLGGPVLGMLAGLAVDPTMTPPAEPWWRKATPDIIFQQARHPQAYAMPEDLDPPRWREMRSAILARRYAADAEPAPAAYGFAAYHPEAAAPEPAAADEQYGLSAQAAYRAHVEAVQAHPLPDDAAAGGAAVPSAEPEEAAIVL